MGLTGMAGPFRFSGIPVPHIIAHIQRKNMHGQEEIVQDQWGGN